MNRENPWNIKQVRKNIKQVFLRTKNNKLS